MSEVDCVSSPSGSLAKILRRQMGFKTKSELAYGVLHEAIVSGILAPGQEILASPIAQELEVSVTPVREAIRMLLSDGLVTITTHTSVRVRDIPIDEIGELLLMRGELEILAMRLSVHNVGPGLLAELSANFDQMEEAMRLGNPDMYGRINRQFHLSLYEASGKRHLVRLITTLWDQMPRARSVFALAPDHMSASQRGHVAILEALALGDAKRATDEMRRHRSLALRRIVGIGESTVAFDGDPFGVGQEGVAG